MAFFRRTFSRRLLPDRFQEISERVYVFDCCLSTKELSEEDYKPYMDAAVGSLQRYHPGASFMVFNFKEGDEPSLLSDILSQHEMTVVDYPRHYEGYPILPLEMIHYCLRSSESWLSLEGQRNVILMHCERGGWPALAFILAGLLLYSKKQTSELKALELVYKQAPKELLTQLSTINPRASQLRYLQYISRRILASDWPPSDAPLAIESLLLMNLPLFDSGKGCRPVVHIYGQDPSMRSNRSPRLLFSSLMSDQGARYYDKEECLLVKIDVGCRVQGDVFVECVHLGEDLVSEEKVFKVMFHTAFVQSYILLLSSSEVDVLWNTNSRLPNDFKAEVFFANPEEVQLRIAKEVKRVEESHESENEFFEAEEFHSSAPQAHKDDSLISREDLDVESYDGKETLYDNYTIEEDTLLDHHNEEREENIDGPHLDHFNESLMSREGLLAETDDGKEGLLDHRSENKQENIDDTHLYNDNWIGLEDLEDTHLDHHIEDKQENIDASLVKSVADVEEIRVDEPTCGASVTLEVDYNDKDSYGIMEVDFHPSVALYENEANVEADGSKVQDTSQSASEVSCSEEEYEPKQADPEVDFETRDTEIASHHLDEFAISLDEDGSCSACVDDKTEINDASKDFASEAWLAGGQESPLEARLEFDIVSKSIVVEASEDEPKEAPSESKLRLNNESKSLLIEESQQDSSKAPPLEAIFEPITVNKSIVIEGSEDAVIEATSESKERLSNESKVFLSEEILEDSSKASPLEEFKHLQEEDHFGGIQDSSEASPLEAIFEPITVSESIIATLESKNESKRFLIEEIIEDSSQAPLSEAWLGRSEDEQKASPLESKTMLNNERKSFLIEEIIEDSSKAPFSEAHFGGIQDYSKASPLEAIFDPIVFEASEDELILSGSESKKRLSNESKIFIIEESLEDISKAPFTEVHFGGSQDYSYASPLDLEALFESNVASQNIVAEGSGDELNVAPLESKTRLNIETKSFLIEEIQEDSSKALPLDAIFEPKIIVEQSEDGPKPVSSEGTIETNTLLEEGQGIVVEATSSEAGLEQKAAGKNSLPVDENREGGSRAGSDQDSSEISFSEMEPESLLMSQSYISIEGSEDCSASETGSELNDQANSSIPVAQAASSETKHIVVEVDDNKEHQVKVQVQPKAADGGSKGVFRRQQTKKKKPRLADAVAKVTMQKRVISMWVPRGKQPAPDDAKQKAPVYKWIPKD